MGREIKISIKKDSQTGKFFENFQAERQEFIRAARTGKVAEYAAKKKMQSAVEPVLR